MVNKLGKIYCTISISDKWLSSFFISLILSLSFNTFFLFYSTFFVLILSHLSGTCAFFFCRYIWAERSLLFWTFLSGTIFAGGGGGVHVHPVHPPPPAYAPALVFENTKPSSKSRHYPSVTNQSSVSNYKNLPYSPKSVAVQQIY